jgi:tetratricopeptide (TPR) repeat protein
MAQEKIIMSEVEPKSYELFSQNNWLGTIAYGKKCISNGYDYYNLRMRIGVSYYNQKKYVKAITHFKKAVDFSSYDALAQEYLYYSYLFSGRVMEAKIVLATFPNDLKTRINAPHNKIIESISVDAGFAVSTINNELSSKDINGSANLYGEATINNNMTYGSVSLNHELGNKSSIYNSYSNIGIDMLKKYSTNVKDTLSSYKLTEHDYYISYTHQFKSFVISPAFHFINVGFNKFIANYNTTNNSYSFSKKDTSFVNFSSSIALSKAYGIFVYGLTAGYAQLNSYTQLQAGVSAVYYPLATTNFYGTSSITYMNQNQENRFVFAQRLGVKLASKLWFDGGVTYGNLQNYSENNALLVYNTSDKILYKYGITLTAPLTKHLELSVRYDGFTKENNYYTLNSDSKVETKALNYATHLVIGGVKWKF